MESIKDLVDENELLKKQLKSAQKDYQSLYNYLVSSVVKLGFNGNKLDLVEVVRFLNDNIDPSASLRVNLVQKEEKNDIS